MTQRNIIERPFLLIQNSVGNKWSTTITLKGLIDIRTIEKNDLGYLGLRSYMSRVNYDGKTVP